MLQTLVLGLGNLLLADEGVGVHVARALIRSGCPNEIVVMDIGTAVLDALPALEQAERIIIVDAVKADGKPGTVYRIADSECLLASTLASLHGFDIFRALALTGRKTKPEVTIFGIEPASIHWSLELSQEVSRALPAVVDAVRKEICASAKR